ncbi:NADH:flavin oxidoreductase/NADH oxidase [Faecalibacter macacae]|uniref:NADH:flavin oxidoreductase/NADH oxidase n=1 Tax=Faecalibacter macacae TaxID=1859289 RepID=A0A3L9MAT8_9FLAO|nr:NADH:flavin oxidoreductase/NADH oxidase [Faecalibacter macacae]RLZ09872.1 NADH:flavin oxidoreductase/NADH oxidase [Faecalibacter macacae]
MSLLFEPIEINESLILKNRIIMSPMCQYSAIDGFPNSWHYTHYVTRAIGGVGAIIVEATAVSPEGRISYGDLGIWNDDQMDAYCDIVEEIKKYNTAPGIQLAHAGRKASCGKPWINYHQIKPNEVHGWQTVSSSELPFYEDDVPPSVLTQDGIDKVVNDFRKAAKRAINAGFQILEIHAAHGYLIHQFFSPLINNRTDEYGGSFENRIRLVLEIVDAIKSEMKTESLWIRISATDWAEGGWNLEDSKKLALILQEKGVDVIDVSTGAAVAHQQIKVEKQYQVPFAKAIKEKTTMLVGAVGLIETGTEAENILQEEKADLIFIGRELLRNPYFPMFASQEIGADVKWPNQYERSKPKK